MGFFLTQMYSTGHIERRRVSVAVNFCQAGEGVRAKDGHTAWSGDNFFHSWSDLSGEAMTFFGEKHSGVFDLFLQVIVAAEELDPASRFFGYLDVYKVPQKPRRSKRPGLLGPLVGTAMAHFTLG
jgi:hypothetical protein